jgi:phosphonate transport system substrate-binding protein
MHRILALCAAAACTLASAADPTELSFGIIATESTQNLQKDWAPIAEDLGTSIGMPVKLFFAPDYSGVIEAMRFSKVQLGWFGNKSAIEVVDRANGEVFCQTIDKDGNPGYWSLIVVHKDSPIQDLSGLIARGKELTFTMGDPQSTSGNLVPGYFAFARNGVDPMKLFKSCRNGNHESNALAVANMQVDAGTFNTEAMFHLERKAPESAKQLRVIWKSDLIASDPLCYRSDLSEGLKAKIKGFFLGYGKDETAKTRLAAVKMSGFKDSNNNQLLPYRQLALIKDKAKLENDTEIDPATRKAKLDAIQAKLDELAKTIANANKVQ